MTVAGDQTCAYVRAQGAILARSVIELRDTGRASARGVGSNLNSGVEDPERRHSANRLHASSRPCLSWSLHATHSAERRPMRRAATDRVAALVVDQQVRVCAAL
jgi:hypothetical protein